MSTFTPVPVPLKQRYHDLRLRVLPVLAFAAALAGLVVLWQNNISAPTLVGQAEPYEAHVSCYKPGMLTELAVTRFQTVKAGDVVGQVLVTDPKILASSLAVIEAEIESLRAGLKPIATQQRTAIDYSQLRLDWMRQRAQLAAARVNLQLAETDLHRTEELFKDKIVAQRTYDQAKATRERYKSEVDELSRLVAEQEKGMTDMQFTTNLDLAGVTDSPLRAAIAVQESKLKLTEAELSPIILRAPMDGKVSTLFHRSGEAVNAGEPIATITAYNSVRIVGYLRAPMNEQPKVGTPVEVRTRSGRRDVGRGLITEIGTEIEPVAPALLGPVKLANLELGLPISVSIPGELKIMPGELVDLTLLPKAD
jgi:multidrug resistance efflux pump